MRGAHRGVWCSKGTPLMEAELFAATAFAPCTVWPRTVMRGKSRKGNSGPESVSKSARRTEPSPRNPRFAAHLRCVSAKEGLGESRGGKGTIRCPCPLLPPPWTRPSPPWVRRFSAARRRQFSPRRGHGLPLTDTAFSAILEIQSTAPPFRFLAAPERK